MTTEVLGKLTFSQVPDVSGTDLLLNAGGIPSLSAGDTVSRPAAGTIGRIYLDTTTNTFYRDNGSSWDAVVATSSITGTANQITLTSGVLAIADNVVLPGTGAMTLPTGTTAQRPASPAAGEVRFNSTISRSEEYTGTNWQPTGGILLQLVDGTIPAATGTSTIPYDNTTPLSTEGTQLWTQTFTPTSTTSRVIIQFNVSHSNSSATTVNIMSLFAGTTCIGATFNRVGVTNGTGTMTMYVVYSPASTAPITFSARFGGSTNTTWYVNQSNSATLGGALASEFTITEIE